MDSKRIFTQLVPELETLPTTPNIFWYVSAGDDFRGLSFLSSYNIDHQMEHHKKELKRPDLFVFNCLGPETDDLVEKLKTQTNPIIFSDQITTIKASNFKELILLNEIQSQLYIDPKYILIAEEYRDRKSTPVYYFEIEVSGDDYTDNHKVLYFEHENIDFFQKIILNSFFKVQYLCATREGMGFGFCKKSIVDHIYKEGANNFYFDKGFRPDYLILFNDFTRDLFKKEIEDSVLISYSEGFCNYPSESPERWGDATVFKLEYDSVEVKAE